MSEKSENTSAISEKPLENVKSEEAAKIIKDVKSTEETKENVNEQNNEDQLETSTSTEQTNPTNENATDKNDGMDYTESEDASQVTKTDQNLKDVPEPTEIAKPVQNETIQEDAEKVKVESDKSPTPEENNTTTASDPEFCVIGDAKSDAEKPADAEDLKLVGDEAEDASKEEPRQIATTDQDTVDSKVTEEVEEAPKEKQSTRDEIQSKTEDSVESIPAKEEDREAPAEIPTQQEEQSTQTEIQPLQADKTENATAEDASPQIESKTEDSVEPTPAKKEDREPSTQEVTEGVPAQQEIQETTETSVVEESPPIENEVKETATEETNQVTSQVVDETPQEESQEQPREETPAETSEVTEPEPEITEEAPQETKVSQPITYDGQEMDPDILKLLEKHLEDIGVINYDIKMAPGIESGENMLGIIAKVQINGIDQNGTNVGLQWIVKIAPPIDALRKMIRLEALYQNEVLMYEAIFPTYKELEQERSIMHGFNSYPEYLFSSLEYQKETVGMTDMTSLGYILRNKKEPLDLEHVKLVMKAYGKLHALSYVFRAKRRDIFEQFTNTFRSNLAEAVDVFELKKTQQPIMDKALETLDPIRHTVTYRKFSRYVRNFMGLYVEASRNVNKYSVIGHGESCINNMLFKYENSSHPDLPNAVCFLDFQVVRHGSPVCDLSYFLFACTDKSFRDQHYDNAIKLYYYSLCSHLTDMGFDPEKVLPLDVLEAELRRFSVVGLYMTILALATILGEAEEHIYNERVRDVILDFCQKGYLDFLFSKKQSSV
ncbi:phosphotransferase [Oryctes borbonicus]|uniref:Phosphotransferase n=1 Tax=Oryctes borbonicus TaxID=1629725 RepID=A0A0T6BEJ1_9SCAR|nr:phosphotransferase [Oryctes borbonicus]